MLSDQFDARKIYALGLHGIGNKLNLYLMGSENQGSYHEQ
jgi:hypothetical protein